MLLPVLKGDFISSVNELILSKTDDGFYSSI